MTDFTDSTRGGVGDEFCLGIWLDNDAVGVTPVITVVGAIPVVSWCHGRRAIVIIVSLFSHDFFCCLAVEWDLWDQRGKASLRVHALGLMS